MTSAEAAALRELVIDGNSGVPPIDPSRLARAYAAMVRPVTIGRARKSAECSDGPNASFTLGSEELPASPKLAGT